MIEILSAGKKSIARERSTVFLQSSSETMERSLVGTLSAIFPVNLYSCLASLYCKVTARRFLQRGRVPGLRTLLCCEPMPRSRRCGAWLRRMGAQRMPHCDPRPCATAYRVDGLQRWPVLRRGADTAIRRCRHRRRFCAAWSLSASIRGNYERGSHPHTATGTAANAGQLGPQDRRSRLHGRTLGARCPQATPSPRRSARSASRDAYPTGDRWPCPVDAHASGGRPAPIAGSSDTRADYRGRASDNAQITVSVGHPRLASVPGHVAGRADH